MSNFRVSSGMWLQNGNCSWLTAFDNMLLRPTYTPTYVITDNWSMHTGSSTIDVLHRRFIRVTIQTNNIDERVASCRCPCPNSVPRNIASYITTMFDVGYNRHSLKPVTLHASACLQAETLHVAYHWKAADVSHTWEWKSLL